MDDKEVGELYYRVLAPNKDWVVSTRALICKLVEERARSLSRYHLLTEPGYDREADTFKEQAIRNFGINPKDFK